MDFTFFLTMKNRNIFCWILIKILYVYLTVNILGGLWYQGYGSYGIDFNLQKEIIAIFCFIAMCVFYSRYNYESDLSTTLVHTLFLIYYIPVNSSYSIHNLPTVYFVEANIYFLLLIIFCLNKIDVTNFGMGKIRALTINYESKFSRYVFNNYIKITLIVICLMCIVYKISYNGFSFSLSIFSETLYDDRAAYVDSLNSMDSTASGYIVTLILNLSKYAIPISLYFSLKYNKVIMGVLSVIALISLFSIIAGKSTLLFAFIVFCLYWSEKRFKIKNFNKLLDISMLTLLVICFILYIFINDIVVYFLFVRRALFLPSWLNYLYYDFFSEHSKVFWSQSTFLLQRLIPSTYDMNPISIISEVYFQSLVPSPNTGLFADAYLNLGIFGIVVYPIIVGKLVKFSNNLYCKYGVTLGVLIGLRLAIHLTNVQLLRTDFVLSYILLSFIIWFLSKINLYKFNNKEH